jgi:hypothetical protein
MCRIQNLAKRSQNFRVHVMRKVILMLLPAVVSNSVKAEWINLGEGYNTIVYANPDTIRRSGNNIYLWRLTEFKLPQVESGKSFLSTKEQMEYNCKNEQYRLLARLVISGSMGIGETIHSESVVEKWNPVTPDTVEEGFFKYACGKK